MLRPSYVEMLKVLNPDDDPKSIAGSRYTIIIATAKRARQLVDHAEPVADKPTANKPVSIAVEELYENKIRIEEGPEEEPSPIREDAVSEDSLDGEISENS